MGYSISDQSIDPETKGIIPLKFCEHNLVVPLKLDGTNLTVVAAYPDSVNVKTALAMLHSKYKVEIMPASEDDVRKLIDSNYYAKCRDCGAKIDIGKSQCAVCRNKPQPMQPQPPPVQPQVQQQYQQYQPAPAPVASVPAHDVTGKTCPYCQFPIKASSAAVVCPSCQIPHHTECWQANGGCTTFGCSQVAGSGVQQQGVPQVPYGYSAAVQAPPQVPVMPMYGSVVGVEYAGFWLRFAAAIIDGLITGCAGGVIGGVLGFMMGAGGSGIATIEAVADILGLLISVCYYVGLNTAYGATVGKMAVGIKIVRVDGYPIDFGIALGRYLLEIIFAVFTCGFAYLVVAINARHQGWHDQITGSVVVRVR